MTKIRDGQFGVANRSPVSETIYSTKVCAFPKAIIYRPKNQLTSERVTPCPSDECLSYLRKARDPSTGTDVLRASVAHGKEIMIEIHTF